MTRFIVRTVPLIDRKAYVAYLQKRIPQLEICSDFLFDYPITSQEKSTRNMIEACRMANDDPVVHLEDDIILTVNFLEKIEAAIAERPDTLIQFFSMRGADWSKGARLENGSNYLMAQCSYFPAGYSKSFVSLYENRNFSRETPIEPDTAIRGFLQSIKAKYFIYIPSLVQHRVCVSAIDRRRSSKRQSYTFVDPDL